MVKIIPGYKHIGIQEGVCGSRPTIIGHRLEPRHFAGFTFEKVKETWDYLTDEQIKEALDFYEKEDPHFDWREKL